MSNILFAALLGVLAICAVLLGLRTTDSRRRTGWMVTAVAAAIQVVNLLTVYSITIAILSAVAIMAGIWMTGRRSARLS